MIVYPACVDIDRVSWQKVASVLKLIFFMYVHWPVSEVCSDSDDPETGMDSDSDDRETGVGMKL